MSNYPKIVYKYRDWKDKYHKRILSKNELFLTSPKEFNDPFDNGIPPDFSLLKTEQEATIYVDYMTKTLKDQLLKQGLSIENAKKIALDKILNQKQNLQKESIKLTTEYQNDFWGILSLSSIWNNTLMWSHYANKHSGFCVGFNEEKLRLSKLFGAGGRVNYERKYPRIHPMLQEPDYGIISTHTKAKDWKYEKEYRLTKIFYPNIPSKLERKVIIDNSFYEEVIIGVNFPKNAINDIRNECMKKNIPLYQATMIPMKFELSRNPIYFM
jgi:hypothetical protein